MSAVRVIVMSVNVQHDKGNDFMAKFLGEFESGSDAWHELRNQSGVVTGTLAATALGLNPWESPFTAWAKATGKIPSEVKQSLPMRLGQLLEPVVKTVWLEQNPRFSIREAGTWEHDDYEWARANPDGFLTYPDGSEGILEVKTGRAFDEPPANYRAQIFWYMFVTGLRKAKLVGLFFGSDLREWDIVWNQFEFDAMFAGVSRWRDCVLNDVRPDWDGSANTFETVKLLNPDVVDDKVELGDLGVELVNAQTDADKAYSHLMELKSRTLDAMGAAKTGVVTVDGVGEMVVATRSLRAGNPVLTVKKGK